MTNKILTIWDSKTPPPNKSSSIYYWSGYSNKNNISSIPQYLEQNSEKFRERYLRFIHEIGELTFNSKRLVDHMEINKGLSYWWMTLISEKSYLKSSSVFECLCLLALDEKLNEVMPHTLRLVTNNEKLAKAIKKCTLSKKIMFEWHQEFDAPKRNGIKDFFRKLPSNVKAIIFILMHILKRSSLASNRKKEWLSGERSIFFFSYFTHLDKFSCKRGEFLSHQWGSLPSFLKKKGAKLNFIHHFFQSPDVPNTKVGLKWINLFNKLDPSNEFHSFLDSGLSLKVIVGALYDFFKISIKMKYLRSEMMKSLNRNSYNYLWVLLENDWDSSTHGIRAIRNTLFLRLIENEIRSLPKQTSGVYLHEGQGWEIAFNHFWRKYNHGKIIGFCHSTVSYWYLMYFNHSKTFYSKSNNSMPKPDFLGVNGKAMRAIMEEAGFPSDYLIDVEAVRYLYLNKIVANKDNACANKILILGDYMPKVNNFILSLFSQLSNDFLKQYKIFFKRHPSVNPIKKELYPGLNINEIDLQLSQSLPSFSIIVSSINTASGAEAFSAGFPVITVLDENNFNSSPLRNFEKAFFVSTANELKKVIQEIFENKSKIENEDFFWLDEDLPRWKNFFLNNN